MLSLQMVDHLFIDVTLLKRPIVYLENGRPLQTTTAEGVDMAYQDPPTLPPWQ